MRTFVRVGSDRQGPTGSGQGGWTAHRFEQLVGRPLTISIRAPIPLDTELEVTTDPSGWSLVTPGRGQPVMTGTPRPALAARTAAVTIDDARRARERFEWAPSEHPVPHCFSCGVGPDSMGVRAGLVDHPDDRHDRDDRDERDVPAAGGRYATDWAPPPWSVSADGAVDAGVLWAALDCTAAWYACGSDDRRVAVTVRYAVDVSRPLDPAGRYALVAWPGGGAPGWVGRKRSAASAAFAEDGTCVATAESLWVSVAG